MTNTARDVIEAQQARELVALKEQLAGLVRELRGSRSLTTQSKIVADCIEGCIDAAQDAVEPDEEACGFCGAPGKHELGESCLNNPTTFQLVEKPLEMRLCEAKRLALKPDIPYIFTVDPKCPSCVAAAQYALGLGKDT